MAIELSPGAWALLGMLHRARHGGPPPPAGMAAEYAELFSFGLALHENHVPTITEAGEATLRQRYIDGR